MRKGPGVTKSFLCPTRDKFIVHDSYAGDGTDKTDDDLFNGERVTVYLSGSSDITPFARSVVKPRTVSAGYETK